MYKPGIPLITPTGDRPAAIKRCIFQMERQTLKPDQWIVADDGKKEMQKYFENISFPVTYIKNEYNKSKGKSFLRNLTTALKNIQYNKILVIEDDDWYHPEYIEVTKQRLQNANIVGQPNALYYNILTQSYRQKHNTKRASLCETAFDEKLIGYMLKRCSSGKSTFVDAHLWHHSRNKNNIIFRLFEDRRLVVGMKGFPGRKGIGIGHRPTKSFKFDPNFQFLKKIIGSEDTKYYIDLKLKILGKK